MTYITDDDTDYSTDQGDEAFADEIFEPEYEVRILLLKTSKFAVINSIDWVTTQ